MTTTNPDIAHKMEKEILREAKNEERALNAAIKDVSHVEKERARAERAAAKADHVVEKAETKEHKAMKSMHKAAHTHDVATSELHQAQNDLEAQTKNFSRIARVAEAKKAQVDAALEEHEEQTRMRNAKLQALRGPQMPLP